MVNKKVIALLLCSAVTVCALPGCGHDITSSDVSDVSTEHTTEVVYKTVEPPDYKWTIEELLSVTYIHGYQLSYPLTLEVLGDEFSIEEDQIVERKNDLALMLDYNGTSTAPMSIGLGR